MTAPGVLSAQRSFRAVMEAMARPGTLHALAGPDDAPAALMPATAALALALFDHDTPLWLDGGLVGRPEVETWLRFRTGAPLTRDPARCAFAVISDSPALRALDGFAMGTDEYPDRSTTLIIEVASLTDGQPVALDGPGIEGAATLAAALPADLFVQLGETRALFPRGLDLILVADGMIAALPRSTRFALGGKG